MKKNENTLKEVTVNVYIGEILDNTDGRFDSMGSAWLTLPTMWVEDKLKKQDFDSLEIFQNEYTYDDTIGWYQQAIEEEVILGAGFGKDIEFQKMATELESLRNIEYVVEDMTSNELEIMSLDSAKEKLISLKNDDEDYQPTAEENQNDLQAIEKMDSETLSQHLESYGYLIR